MATYFKDKVVIVTGGTDGIGKALVEELLAAGAKVATCGRDHDKLYRLQSDYPSYHLHTMVPVVMSVLVHLSIRKNKNYRMLWLDCI